MVVNCDICENIVKYLCRNCYDWLCDRCKDIYFKSKVSFDYEVMLLIFELLFLFLECLILYVCKWYFKFCVSIGC